MRALGIRAALAAAGLFLARGARAGEPPPAGGDPWPEALQLAAEHSSPDLARTLRELQKEIQALADRAAPAAEALEALDERPPQDIGQWRARREPLHEQAYGLFVQLEERGGVFRKHLYAYEYQRLRHGMEDVLVRGKRQVSPRDLADDAKLRSFEVSVRRLQERLADAMDRDRLAFAVALEDHDVRRRNRHVAGLLAAALALTGLAAWRLKGAPPARGG